MTKVYELSQIPLLRGLDNTTLDRIAATVDERACAQNELMAEQHDEARHVFFLLCGTVQFLIRVEGVQDLLVGTTSAPGALLGWSAFRPPYRYTSSLRCETPCRVLAVNRDVFDKILAGDPSTGLEILKRVAVTMADRMVQARDRLLNARVERLREYSSKSEQPGEKSGDLQAPANKEDSVASGAQALLARSTFFENLTLEQRNRLAAQARWRAVSAGETVLEENALAEHLYIVAGGRFELSTAPMISIDGAQSNNAAPIVTLDEPGDTIGWSALVPPYRYRATATALCEGRLLELNRKFLEDDAADSTALGIALMKRVLWVLGHRLRAIRTRLIASRYDEEVLAVKSLIDQSIENLHMDSPLLKIPHYLENRLTVADAFHCLNLVKAHGDDTERHLAELCLELLDNVHRQLRFYTGLQTVYEHIANAPAEAHPNLLRLRCSREFIAMFKGLDYRIVGEENLPPTSGHIFIMNHLCSHSNNALPNNFKIILDTHFVSSMILHRKYGEPPIRVVRGAHPNEIGQKAYYERLGYIMVPPQGHPRDPAVKPGEARSKLRAEAKAHLTEGKNLVICPEGACTTTEQSPLAFKSGAFGLAADADPEPLIVPIAIANFDKEVTRTRMVAVIHQPFRLSEKLPRPVDRGQLRIFVNEYRETFRGYIEEARQIAVGESESESVGDAQP